MNEIINSDGSRNWQANILNDQIKRLEQENKELKRILKDLNIVAKETLEYIRYLIQHHDHLSPREEKILARIDEVLK